VLDAGWETPPSFNLLTELRKACVDAGGAMVLQRAPIPLKRRLGVWGEPRGDFALMRAIKDELDPKRLLNPGRFVGDI
jgi:glycolate oxidase FAD binding subunit